MIAFQPGPDVGSAISSLCESRIPSPVPPAAWGADVAPPAARGCAAGAGGWVATLVAALVPFPVAVGSGVVRVEVPAAGCLAAWDDAVLPALRSDTAECAAGAT